LPEGVDALRASLAGFVAEYFGSWSRGDMAAYARCFHPMAQISHAAGYPVRLTEFLATQRAARLMNGSSLVEVPESWSADVATSGRIAQLRVFWSLYPSSAKSQHSITTGVDFFTLHYVGGQWIVVALSFFSPTQLADILSLRSGRNASAAQ
jgi:hypothetical protein